MTRYKKLKEYFKHLSNKGLKIEEIYCTKIKLRLFRIMNNNKSYSLHYYDIKNKGKRLHCYWSVCTDSNVSGGVSKSLRGIKFDISQHFEEIYER